MNKRAYITGKVGKHLNQITLDRFNRLKAKAEADGYTDIAMPVKLGVPTATRYDSLRTDIKTMLDKDVLILDVDWHDSKRSVLLRGLAMSIEMDIVYPR